MDLFAQLEAERRQNPLENPSVGLGDEQVWDWLDFGPTSSAGVKVTPRSALAVSAFFAGVRFLSQTIASLPIRLHRRLDRGRDTLRSDTRHIMWTLLPNPEMTAYQLREALQGHLEIWGNAYVEIQFDGRDQPRHVWPLLPDRTKPVTVDGELAYETFVDNTRVLLPPRRVMHIPAFGGNGRSGYSVLQQARDSLGLSIAAEDTAADFYSRGMRADGVLSAPGTLSDKTRNNLAKYVNKQVGGLNNKQRLLILEGGLEWQQLGIPPGDAQFLESRQFQVREIARWLGLPPHIIGDLEDATFSNIESQSLELVTYSLMPRLTRWEQALGKSMLTEDELGELFWKIDARGLLRGDQESRANYMTARHNMGSLTANEIREIEDENPLDVPGADEPMVNAAVVPLRQAMDMTVDERVRLLTAAQGHATPPVDGAGQPARSPSDAEQQVDPWPMFREAWERLARGELRELRRMPPDEWGSYYRDEFPEFAARVLHAPLTAIGADVDATIARYAFDARRALTEAADGQREALLEGWLDRASTWAESEWIRDHAGAGHE